MTDKAAQTENTRSDSVPWRLQIAVYGIGLFSTSMFYMSAIVVPLWIASIEQSVFLIGVALGARHFLPLFLSIHGGVLMDRLGGRRVMVFFAAIGVAVPLLFPVMPIIWAALVLQMISGLVDAMGWLGAQTLIGQHMKGSTVYTGRLSYTCRAGHLIAPPAIGWVWDVGGPIWGFVGLSLWCVGTLLCSLALPAARNPASPDSDDPPPRVRVADVMPRVSDYVGAFRLVAVPAIALVVMCSMMTHVGASVHSTFYVVYLGDQGINGTQIGLLLSASSVAAAGGALIASWTARRIRPYWLMLGAILTSILAVAVTPLLGLFVLLVVASAVRGASNGLTQPMVISTVLRAVEPEKRGSAAGIRATFNRVASIVSPILMGAVAELTGIVNAFYFVGAMAIVLIGLLAIHVARSPVLSASNVVQREES